MSDLCDFDLSPEEERDILRGIHFEGSFYHDPDLALVAVYLLHKFWGIL